MFNDMSFKLLKINKVYELATYFLVICFLSISNQFWQQYIDKIQNS